MIKVDNKGFDFYCHKKEQWMDNGCKINFIDLILQTHEPRKWVDLTSNFLHYLSNLFEKVFVGLNHQIFQLWLEQRFWCPTTSSSSLYSAAEHTSLTAFLTNHIGYQCKSIPKSDFYHTSMQSRSVSLSFSYIHLIWISQ